jgi:hypothetical protein
VDRRFLRPGWIAGHVLVFLAFLTCLRLGWWQWERTHDTDGTAQNFGYALLWPAFGVAFIYMWVRFLHLEVLKDEQDDEATERGLRAILDEVEQVDGGPGAGQDPAAGVPSPPTPAEVVGGETDLGPSESPREDSGDVEDDSPRSARRGRWNELQRPSRAIALSTATVGEDDDDDPELTAYNQALAALAEEDRRRAR